MAAVMESDIEAKLSDARKLLCFRHPFYAALALRLRTVIDPTCDTAWTDGKRIGWCPEYVEKLTRDELLGVMAHEVMHCAHGHQARRGERLPVLWNVATDYAINGLLKDGGFTLPEGGLHDPQYDGMSAERIYSLLPPVEVIELPATGADPGGCGEVRDASGADGDGPASKAELEAAAREWEAAAHAAAMTARNAGKLSGEVERFLGADGTAVIDWREELSCFITSRARDDYSWSRQNRRHVHAGRYLPAMHSERCEPLVIAIDTSASISGEVLACFVAEIRAAADIMRPESITVVHCDYDVNRIDVYALEDMPETITPIGGGGTRFSPVWEALEAAEVEPACVVYLTDLECYEFGEEPAYPVLWARYGGGGAEVPFGRVIDVDPHG